MIKGYTHTSKQTNKPNQLQKETKQRWEAPNTYIHTVMFVMVWLWMRRIHDRRGRRIIAVLSQRILDLNVRSILD